MALTCIHMGSTFLLCNAFYWIRPDLYPTMQQTEGKRLQMLVWFCPLAVMFAVGLFCSNQAYIYCSPAFLQFMKEGNVALVFFLSCALGLQACTRARFVNVVWILVGSSMAVSGQVHFVLTGFAFQLISQFGECGKNVMGDWMMKSHLKLDALTYTMFLSPMCLMVLMVGAVATWKAEILTDFAAWWMYILPNASLAFTLNVTISLLIKECSAFAFILAGLVKDAFIVMCGAALLGETVVRQQYMAFFVCLSGVFFWSYSKINPHAPVVQLFQKVCFSECEEVKKPLLPKTEKAQAKHFA
eukprot:CAMPEP_0194503994 /NCGR_PEP_ID=MMETSP0253-20130528/28698_1 /TAXON_ID=2966 /ORGANISM="Noctiluca scintillans" /LENGTH=299 /DNA_ID=CAMNT_0039346335 /DNA_START=163 /DNA_END=1062 /DNA_ORIENTATION=-